jgi:hypothetical protein
MNFFLVFVKVPLGSQFYANSSIQGTPDYSYQQVSYRKTCQKSMEAQWREDMESRMDLVWKEVKTTRSDIVELLRCVQQESDE